MELTKAPSFGSSEADDSSIGGGVTSRSSRHQWPEAPILSHENMRLMKVPVCKEKLVPISKREIHETATRVPVFNYQYEETLVEVPHIEVVTREVEVEQVVEVPRRVPVKKVMEVQKVVTKYVPKVITKIVEKEVEIPGDLIQIPKPYRVENKIIVPRYVDDEVPMVVHQVIEQTIQESDIHQVQVALSEYVPYLVPVNVYLPVPVEREFIPVHVSHAHRSVNVLPSQFNALVIAANEGATDQDMDGLFVKQCDGRIEIINTKDRLRVVEPLTDEWRVTHASGQLHVEAPEGEESVFYPLPLVGTKDTPKAAVHV